MATAAAEAGGMRLTTQGKMIPSGRPWTGSQGAIHSRPLYHSGEWVLPPHPSLDQGNNLQQPLRKVCCVCPWPLGHPA